MTPRQREVVAALERAGGNVSQAARDLGMRRYSVQCILKRVRSAEDADPAIASGMAALGLETTPAGGWVKNSKPDDDGRTYSFYVRPERQTESLVDTIATAVEAIPAVVLPEPPRKPVYQTDLLGFLPLNDLHAGMKAWGKETGYEDWDLRKAIDRLVKWVGNLLNRMPACEECVLFYNGDTLHANGNEPLTPASKHILDVDTRHFHVVDCVTAAIIATVDMAAQRHRRVRLVIKRGNHDEDAYLALLMAAKWRYRDTPNVIVEEDPCAYWAYEFGLVAVFGHHCDRIKHAELVMKFAADHPEVWGRTRYRYIWTAHLHDKAVQTFHGATCERASCITAPDAYGARWGDHAQALAVIYHRTKGELERHVVRPEIAEAA